MPGAGHHDAHDSTAYDDVVNERTDTADEDYSLWDDMVEATAETIRDERDDDLDRQLAGDDSLSQDDRYAEGLGC